ncbi:MAG TPA: hypothetical protein VN698_05045 [Bacteroidia bacterium]|nr:hypothetical protein [Bacteroidia bacterium]
MELQKSNPAIGGVFCFGKKQKDNSSLVIMAPREGIKKVVDLFHLGLILKILNL